MRRLSEVVKMTGVTRRSIQEWDKHELIRHKTEKETGYWLFDDEDIILISNIRMLMNFGYSREMIKNELLMLPMSKLSERLKKQEEVIKEKIEKMENDILDMKLMQLIINLPTYITNAFDEINIDTMFLVKNTIKAEMKNLKEQEESLEEEDISDEEKLIFAQILFSLCAVGLYKSRTIRSSEVQQCLKKLSSDLFNLYKITPEFQVFYKKSSEEEKNEEFKEFIQFIIHEEVFHRIIESIVKEDGIVFIEKSVNYYCKQRKEK